jgi:hypothetical protein
MISTDPVAYQNLPADLLPPAVRDAPSTTGA